MARAAGVTWPDLAATLSEVLREHGLQEIRCDTLRGIVGRFRRERVPNSLPLQSVARQVVASPPIMDAAMKTELPAESAQNQAR